MALHDKGVPALGAPQAQTWLIKLYRKGSVTTVEYDRVKHAFWMAGDTVLCIARYTDDGSHYYIHWPREEIAWFTAERA